MPGRVLFPFFAHLPERAEGPGAEMRENRRKQRRRQGAGSREATSGAVSMTRRARERNAGCGSAPQGRARRLRAVLLMLVLALALSPAAALRAGAAPLAVPVASAARVTGDLRQTRFVADLTFAIPFNVYVLPDPCRVMIDLPAVDFRIGGRVGNDGEGLITAVRYGRMGQGKARIVLDVRGPVLIRKSYVLHPTDERPARLVVELVPTDRATFDALLAARPGPRADRERRGGDLPPLRASDPVPEDMPVVTRAYRRLVERAAAGRPPASIADLLEADGPLSFARPGGAGGAKSRTKGHEKKGHEKKRPAAAAASAARRPLIVIDPGHGGKDPGASGGEGVKEKGLVLRFARALRDRLLADGRFRVLLTREKDVFLTLPERVRFARKHGANLFISIHADKFRSRAARGASIYTLSEEASDEEAAELARKENAADIIGGVDLGAEGSDEIKGILIDLTMRETKNHSVFLARALAREMRKVIRMRRRPVRSADFRVLRNPEVPSVLVELGYVSNAADLRNMRSPRWRAKAAAAMARAISGHFAARVASRR